MQTNQAHFSALVILPMSGQSVVKWWGEIGVIYLVAFVYGSVWLRAATIAKDPKPLSWFGIVSRAVLPFLCDYAGTLMFYDDQAKNLLVDEYEYKNGVFLLTQVSFGWILLRCYEQGGNLRNTAIPIAMFLLVVHWVLDIVVLAPILHWDVRTYFLERGLRMLPSVALAYLAREATIVEQKAASLRRKLNAKPQQAE